MPVKITKISSIGGGRYRVSTPSQVHAKSTTKAKAEAQARLLRAVEHNPKWKPTGRRAKRKYA